MTPAPPGAGRKPHVQAIRKPDGRTYLYYRRDGKRTPLPSPEGSAAFLAAYDKIHSLHEMGPDRPAGGDQGTVAAAITAYLAGADFENLAQASQRNYRWSLDRFRERFGPLRLRDLDPPWWEALRARYGKKPADWNALRSRMREVIKLHRRLHPKDMTSDPLAEVTRLKTGKSDQNRPWPRAVLEAVMTAATPEFRALLIAYLLTVQRGGDVTGLPIYSYDDQARTLTLTQGKTDEHLVLHVPDRLAATFSRLKGRHGKHLLVTPRGVPWTLNNAQETLRRLLGNLDLPRYTLHGLRATGPTALKMAGVPNQEGRALTGHNDDRSYELYTRGADRYLLGKQASEKLENIFGGIIDKAEAAGNQSRATGLTGRAAAKAQRKTLATEVATVNSAPFPDEEGAA